MFITAVSIIFTLLTITTTQEYEVPCPTNSNSSQFTDCYQCAKYPHSTDITCSCDKNNFNLIGRCVPVKIEDCVRYPYFIYLVAYQWKDIGIFWDQIFNETRSTQPDPVPLSNFMNSFNFETMTNDEKIGWIQAYYMYQILKPEIELLSNQSQISLVFQTVVFIDSILNQTFPEMRAKFLNFTNIKLQKNWTEAQFQKLIDNRVKNIISCIQCFYLYGLAPAEGNPSQQICIKCPSNCRSCTTTNVTLCTYCVSLHSLNSLNQCVKCPPNCVICTNNSTECTQCQDGFVLTNLTNTTKQCLACDEYNCRICDQTGICQQCFYGIPLNSQKQCIAPRPSQSLTPCKPNNSNQPCTSCTNFNQSNNMWANSQGECFTCPDLFCSECNETNSSQCLICIDQFYWNSISLKCEECPENCIMCQQNNCQQCKIGFRKQSNVCKPCAVLGCYSCDSNISLCDVCLIGRVNQLRDECVPQPNTTLVCPIGCSDCYENNRKECYSCQKAYFKDNQNRICRKCLSNCEYCTSENTCSKCFLSFTLVNQTCISCTDNCLECNITGCVMCRSGFELVNSTCQNMNNDGCIDFSPVNLTQCLLCRIGFTLHPNGRCMQCSINCEFACNPFNINECMKTKHAMQISYVFTYYFHLQGCFMAINGECFYATPGYKIEKVDGKFVAKYSCLRPCLTCNESNIMQCFSCENGYVLSGQKCVPDLSCNPNCTSCSFQSYRDVTTNQCLLCNVQNCGSCFNGECLECSEGYYLENGTCKVCSVNCKTCLDAQICKICTRGYVFPYQSQNGPFQTPQPQICVKCSPNCRTCLFSETTCSSCHQNSRLINARCVSNIVVAFEYRLNVQFSTFLSLISSQTFIDQISRILNISSNKIIIIIITEGSTVINGQISSDSELQAKAIANTLQKNPPTNYPILGSSLNIVNNGQDIECISTGSNACPNEVQTENKLSAGAIVGIAIGSAVFAIGLIVAVIFIVKKIYKPSLQKTNINQQVKTRQVE